ncbi:MAG: formate dehydrogenase subunit gamma [Gammaproteobacteria bacterium]|jgi:formate dehydrogenase subunit gamma
MGARKITSRSGSRGRAALITVALSLLAVMALPLTGYVLHDAGVSAVAQSQEDSAAATNPRAEYWRAVREGVSGYTSVEGQETGVLIQNGGENWQEVRNGPVTFYGGSFIIAVLIALAAKHVVFGKQKLEEETGRRMTRWSAFERIMHWYVAITFIVLAITGLSLIFGRTVLIPVMGKEAFAAFAAVAKPVHDYLALPFTAGLILMLLLWIPKNMLKGYDFKWLASAGGFFGDGHPPAGFANAGEKVFFWLLFFGGIALMVSGFYLLFPNFGWERSSMQLAHVVHAVSGLFLIGVSLGHMYLGTFGVEGVLEGMIGGEVDEGFAKQHHNVWYDEVKSGGTATSRDRAPAGTSAAAPST